MARSLKEAEKMAAAARENPHLVTQIVPAPFSFSYDKKMKAIFNELPYGELRNAQLVHTVSSAVDVTTPMTWRQDVYLSGKNILSMGIFYETISRWFSEVPEWIIAHGDTFTTMRHSDRSDRLENVQIPDAITIMSGYESGSRIDYHFSGVEYGAGKAEITLNFQEATLIINFNQGSFKLYTQEIPQGEEIEISDEDIMTWQVEADFIDSIRNGTPVSLTSVEKGLEYMRFTELVHQSRRHSGMRVRWNL
jgi:predicted dehydrogenase